MGAYSALLALSFLWFVIHFSSLLARRHSARLHLPAPALYSSDTVAIKNARITLKGLHVRIDLHYFSLMHDRLTTRLTRKKTYGLQKLQLLYNVGSVSAAIGISLALGLMLFTSVKLVGHLMALQYDVAISGNLPDARISKRAFSESDLPQLAASSNVATLPYLLIPGVTIPMYHSLPLLLALFASQVIHEAGHAITAALDGVQLLSVGASLTVMLPSAFVSLSRSDMEARPSLARLRIISSGPWHNLILWAILWVVTPLSVGNTFWSLAGYEYIGNYGRVVVAVEQTSPLNGYLHPGAIVTQLDDFPLVSPDPSTDLWSQYLSTPVSSSERELGWCVDLSWFLAHPDDCCSLHHPPSQSSCFVVVRPHTTEAHEDLQKCLHPVTMFASNQSTSRCSRESPCSEAQICTSPKEGEELMRVIFWNPYSPRDGGTPGDDKSVTSTVVWSGPREEVLEDVEVGLYRSRLRFLPLRLPIIVNLFMQYISTLSISLYLFNLLPLRVLDGGQYLDALLDYLLAHQYNTRVAHDIELAPLQGGSDRTLATRAARGLGKIGKSRILAIAQSITVVLLAACILLGLAIQLID